MQLGREAQALVVVQAKTLFQPRDHLQTLMSNTSPLALEKLTCLKELTYEEFILYTKELFNKVFVEGTLHGNITQTESLEFWTQLKDLLAADPYPPQEHTQKEVITLPENDGPHMLNFTTDRQGTGVILTIDQGTSTLEKRAAQGILATTLKEGFFNTLRTKQQTAYMAYSWPDELENHLFQSFAVQSSTHAPSELLARFELFLEDFLRNFDKNHSKERFETIRASHITKLERSPENLGGMASKLHSLAFKYDGEFDRIQKRIEAYKNLSYDTVKALAAEWLSRSNHRRLAILMEGAPCSDTPFRYQTVSKEALTEKSSYVAWK